MKRYALYLVSSVMLLAVMIMVPQSDVSTTNQTTADNMVKIGNFYMDKYEFPNHIGDMPVTDVNWHEAAALCESVGKRLCAPDEWVRACRGPQGLRFPYGPTYDPTKCNSESRASEPMRIGETPATCVSGYGVHDLNGNVWEWVGLTPEESACAAARGAVQAAPNARCCSGKIIPAPKANWQAFGVAKNNSRMMIGRAALVAALFCVFAMNNML